MAEEAVDRLLEYDAGFIEAVKEGRASAKRGDLLEHDEVLGLLRHQSFKIRWLTPAEYPSR